MRFSAPTTTLVFLGLATLAATTTTSTGNETCTPRNWQHNHVASSSWAVASAAFDLSDAAPVTTALNLTCVGGLLAPTAKGTLPLDRQASFRFVPRTISVPWADTTTSYYTAYAVPAVTAVSIKSIPFEMVEKFISTWSSSPPAILWFDMGLRFCPARPAGVQTPRPRVTKGALQAMMAAAFGEIKSFIVAQVRAWGSKMLVASALFAAAWKTGITIFVCAYTIAKYYAPVLLTGLLCVYTAIAFLIAVGGMVVICCNTCWHMKENISASWSGLETVLEGDAKKEEEDKEEKDWVMVESEEEIDESYSPAPEEHLSALSIVYFVLSVALFFVVLAFLLSLGALLSFVECIVRVTNKATSMEEEEEELHLLLEGLLGDFAPVLPGLAFAGLGALVSYIHPLVTKGNIVAVMDAIATFEKSVQPLYDDAVNIVWYVLAGFALLAVAFVVLLARVASRTILNVLSTSVVEEEEEEGDAATYSSLSSLAYLAAVLAIPGSIWVASIILVLYFALPDGPNEKRLSISANNDGSGADTERFRSESGLPSAARRVLQRVSVSLWVGWTCSVEATNKEEGGEVMADASLSVY